MSSPASESLRGAPAVERAKRDGGELKQVAVSQGMRPLRADGFEKRSRSPHVHS